MKKSSKTLIIILKALFLFALIADSINLDDIILKNPVIHSVDDFASVAQTNKPQVPPLIELGAPGSFNHPTKKDHFSTSFDEDSDSLTPTTHQTSFESTQISEVKLTFCDFALVTNSLYLMKNSLLI